MPSRSETAFSRARRLVAALSAVMVVAVTSGAASAQDQAAEKNVTRPGPAEIARALDVVKADPNLATERTIKTLQWKDAATDQSGPSPWLAWLAGFFRWLAESARVLVWGAAVVLAGLLVVFVVRMVRARGGSRPLPFLAPTHVRDLDIRPESLPDDLGSAARALWDRGEHRAALALLYRGMLSRLAHVHRVPIRDSTTEGDCLMLAAQHLAQPPCEYAARLVSVWQRYVYAGQEIQGALVYLLCDDFAGALDASAAMRDSGPPAGVA